MSAVRTNILAGLLSASVAMASVTPAFAAPARAPAKPAAATPAPPPVQIVRTAMPLPPANETPAQRKKREKAAEKARKQALKAENKRLHPNRHEGRKKLLACAGGAALGIVAGMLLSNRRNRGEMVVAGAIGGCAAGWALRGALKGDDEQRLNAFVNDDVALRDGDPVRAWKAPNSGETILIQQADAGYKPVQAVFTLGAGVETPQSGVVIVARAMRTTTALRLRAAPNTISDSNIIGTFAPNEIVQMIAQTSDRQWALIGVGGVVVGYASTAYLSSSLAIPADTPIRFAAMKPPPPRPVARTARRGRAPAPVVRAAVAPAAPRQATVLASTNCKAITASHGSNSSTQKRCANSDMTWA